MSSHLAKAPKIVYGSAAIGSRDPFVTEEGINELFATLDKHNITILDTAQLYGPSEQRLGEMKAGNKYTIDSKWIAGWSPGSATEENVISSAEESTKKLGIKKFDIFYLHAPDLKTPISSTLAGVNKAHQAGIFTRFGLSNFTPAQTRETYNHCKENNYVLPSVYQGNYSAVARVQDKELIPMLRELNMCFYAYSPIAGGFLAKTRAQIEEGQGRFNKESLNGMYMEMYNKPSYLKALEKWETIADKEGCSRAELAYRWVAYHSMLRREKGDGIIVGASSTQQLEGTMKGLEKGPLSEDGQKGCDEVWKMVEKEAPTDNFVR